MANHTAQHIAPTGGTYYAYPAYSATYTLANWATHSVELVELASPNEGLYQGTLDDSKGAVWNVFLGTSQPATWDDAVAQIDLSSEINTTSLEAISEQTTDISQDLATLTIRAAFGFTVLPSVRSNGSNVDISTFVGEQQSPLIPLSIDLTAEELEVVWEPPTERNTTEIAVLFTEDLEVTEDSIQFRLPSEVYSTIRQLKYSIRKIIETSESDAPDKIVILQGIWTIMTASLRRT